MPRNAVLTTNCANENEGYFVEIRAIRAFLCSLHWDTYV